MSNGVKAWSYSALSTYEECPHRYYRVKLKKDIADPPSKALLKGRRVHKAGEDYLKTPNAPFPGDYAKFTKLMMQLKSLNPFSELQLTFKQDWSLGTQGWFGKDVWLRLAFDAVVVYPDGHADLVDFKTGKRYEKNDDQMELQALTAFLKWKPTTVGVRLWYLESGLEPPPKEYHAEQVPHLLSKWNAKAQKLFDETAWNKKPGDHCTFCPVAISRGGDCRHG